MKTKHIIIIVAVIAVVAVIGGYFLLNSSFQTTEHTTIVLSKSAYMEVPNANASNNVDKNGIFHYNDKKDDINITSCSNLSASSSVNEMKKLKNSVSTGAKKIKDDNVVIYEKDGVYSIFVKNVEYNDTLLIQSTDKNLLLECWNTVKYHDPTDKIKFDNTTGSGSGSVVNVVEKTQSVVTKSTSSTSSSSSSSSSGSASYSDFGFSSSKSSSKSSSSGSGGKSYSDFGF